MARSKFFKNNRVLLLENVVSNDAGIISCKGRVNIQKSKSTFQSVLEVLGIPFIYFITRFHNLISIIFYLLTFNLK